MDKVVETAKFGVLMLWVATSLGAPVIAHKYCEAVDRLAGVPKKNFMEYEGLYYTMLLGPLSIPISIWCAGEHSYCAIRDTMSKPMSASTQDALIKMNDPVALANPTAFDMADDAWIDSL